MKLRRIVPLKRIPLQLRWDIWLLSAVYSGLSLAIIIQYHNTQQFLWTSLFFILIGSILLGVIFILLQVWIIHFRMFIQYKKESVEKADFVFIVPMKHKGLLSIEQIYYIEINSNICGSLIAPNILQYFTENIEFSGERIENQLQSQTFHVPTFTYQRRLFFYSNIESKFISISFPEKLSIKVYFKQFESGGLKQDEIKEANSQKIISPSLKLWGLNSLEVPLPSFISLLIIQLIAPLFLYQVFCSILWLFDQYSFFSIYILLIIVILELTSAAQKRWNMQKIRQMTSGPKTYLTLRENKWIDVMSDKLRPGDVISISMKQQQQQQQQSFNINEQQLQLSSSDIDNQSSSISQQSSAIPTSSIFSVPSHPTRSFNHNEIDNTLSCDVVLLAGRVVVNESLLTGESMPVVKEGLITIPKDQWNNNLDPKSIIGKQHILLAGTSLLQIVTTDKLYDNTKEVNIKRKNVENKEKMKDNKGEYQFNNPTINTIDPSKYICPDGGCPAIVTRTGFSTTQGKLLRAIVFFSENISANSSESFIFMLMMMVVAVITGVYVYINAKREHTPPFQLFLRLSEIVTSVIPPQLPIQLSIAVNTAIQSLQKRGIFCTEPFRIQDAARIDLVCFDKTGTLTEDKLIVEGIVNDLEANGKFNQKVSRQKNKLMLKSVHECKDETILVLAGCHSLSIIENDPNIHIKEKNNQKLIGDPLERVAFESTGWYMNNGGNECHNINHSSNQQKQQISIQFLHRFIFDPQLARSSTIVKISIGNEKSDSKQIKQHKMALCKGSPESILSILKDCNNQSSISSNQSQFIDAYTHTYEELAQHGSRVIALSYKILNDEILSDFVQQSRNDVENDLTFAGLLNIQKFLLNLELIDFWFQNALFVQNRREQLEDYRTDHQCKIITGDNIFTAIDVAKEVGIIENENNLIIFNSDKKIWERINDKNNFNDYQNEIEDNLIDLNIDNKYLQNNNNLSDVEILQNDFPLCITGDGLDYLIDKLCEKNNKGEVNEEELEEKEDYSQLLQKSSKSDFQSQSQQKQTKSSQNSIYLQPIIPYLNKSVVFARMTPKHKEMIVIAFRKSGHIVMMCGDGSNDTAAIKASNVGIAILPKKIEQKKRNNKQTKLNILNNQQQKEKQSTVQQLQNTTELNDKINNNNNEQRIEIDKEEVQDTISSYDDYEDSEDDAIKYNKKKKKQQRKQRKDGEQKIGIILKYINERKERKRKEKLLKQKRVYLNQLLKQKQQQDKQKLIEQGERLPRFYMFKQWGQKFMYYLAFTQTSQYGGGIDAGLVQIDEEIELLGGNIKQLQLEMQLNQAHQRLIQGERQNLGSRFGLINNNIRSQNNQINIQQRGSNEQLEEQEQISSIPLIHLGDASSAAPFSARRGSLISVIDVIRYGRAAKMNVQMMFKVLALQSFLLAFRLSILAIAEARASSMQLILSSFASIGFVITTYRSLPLKRLYSVRPPNSIFSLYQMLSLFVQAGLQLGILALSYHLALTADSNQLIYNSTSESYIETFNKKLGKFDHTKDNYSTYIQNQDSPIQPWIEFQPTLINTVVFLITMVQSVVVMATNYIGEPYMEKLIKRKALLFTTIIQISFVFLLAFEIIPGLNIFVDLSPFPSTKLKIQIIGLIALTATLPFLWEFLLKKIFLREKWKKLQMKKSKKNKKTMKRMKQDNIV